MPCISSRSIPNTVQFNGLKINHILIEFNFSIISLYFTIIYNCKLLLSQAICCLCNLHNNIVVWLQYP